MLLQLSGEINIEDRWNHPLENVEELRRLLAEGVEAIAEPQRRDFYEIDNGFHIFYIHVCPNGKVLLLAIWPRELQVATQPANYLRAASAV
jgi:DNA-binding GntR family transcriptional regulator